MKTFSIQTLGCRVNHYESEQIAAVLSARGLTQVPSPGGDVRVVHTCSVTMAAAKGSRQAVRRVARSKTVGLPVLETAGGQPAVLDLPSAGDARVIVTGCWATSDPDQAAALAGVDAVVTQHDDVHAKLAELLDTWQGQAEPPLAGLSHGRLRSVKAQAGAAPRPAMPPPRRVPVRGSTTLPQLNARQSAHQRAFLKIQDGCDAHCTYCIIPQLRPTLWSKPIDDAVAEARALVAAGHHEIVLTGIFLGAYGKPTALRRRQSDNAEPVAQLIDALCARVQGLSRLRLSSLEPGDLTPSLLNTLRSHAQVVPHFHLPLQSGSDAILRKMNRQYTRAEYLDMAAMLKDAFDRPAITTDIIVGFPGETEADFVDTLDIAERVGFIHTHAFTYSPRPRTAAARWTEQAIPAAIANARIHTLINVAGACGLAFRRTFVGQIVTVLVEHPQSMSAPMRHGRCERYFDVWFASNASPGKAVRVRIEHATLDETVGTVVETA